MTQNNTLINNQTEFEGVFGKYEITKDDIQEVKNYRMALFITAISLFAGISHWLIFGFQWVWIWIFMIAVSFGFALQWIHIYLKSLHNVLKILWLLGITGIIYMAIRFGLNEMMSIIKINHLWVIAIGPLFASITGVSFKEFFCFRRPEALALTIFLPISLIGYITNTVSEIYTILLLYISSIFNLILTFRKFGMDANLDIGDKSIFMHLNQKSN